MAVAAADIGDRVRRWRRRRGMTQEMLAGRAGVTQSWISHVERGTRQVDRKAMQLAVAGALDITVAQLLGYEDEQHVDPVLDRAVRHVPAVRSMLVELSAGEVPAPSRPRDVVEESVRHLTTLRNAADYAAMMPQLPRTLADVAGYGEPMAAQMVEVLFGARYALRSIGQLDLAMMAGRVGLDVGRAQPSLAWRAQALYSYVQAFPAESAGLGVRLVGKEADVLQGETDRDSREMYGCLHIVAAFWASIAGQADEAWAHLAEAGDVAAALGEPVVYAPLSAGFNANWFGPTQVDIWRIAIAAELGDVGAALNVSGAVDLGAMPLANRLVYYWTDLARALAAGGRDVEAMHALARAERAAPQHFRANPVVKNLAVTLVTRARRRAVGVEMAALARRLGLDPL